LVLAPVVMRSTEGISHDGAMEKLALVSTNDRKTWSAAECTVEPSTTRTKVAPSSWRWQVDVDHFTGEPKYPIGWPRIGHAIPAGPLRDWSEWDFLHMWIYVETSRETLPTTPAGLGVQAPDRANMYERNLGELKKDQWVEINIPMTQIARHDDVRQIQFHIAEANYRHGDRLVFYLNDLALMRHAEPTVFDLAAENAVIFSDTKRLPVRFQLLGVKAGDRVDVACELLRDGKTAARASSEAGRGAHRLVLELGQPTLAPGNYEVRARIGGRPQVATTSVRVVESPWK
jgi:hypothetical protein